MPWYEQYWHKHQTFHEKALHKLDHIERQLNQQMTAIEDLTKAVEELEGAEAAAAAEFTVLAEEIAELKAGTISEAEVESLAGKASAVAAALKSATPEGKV